MKLLLLFLAFLSFSASCYSAPANSEHKDGFDVIPTELTSVTSLRSTWFGGYDFWAMTATRTGSNIYQLRHAGNAFTLETTPFPGENVDYLPFRFIAPFSANGSFSVLGSTFAEYDDDGIGSPLLAVGGIPPKINTQFLHDMTFYASTVRDGQAFFLGFGPDATSGNFSLIFLRAKVDMEMGDMFLVFDSANDMIVVEPRLNCYDTFENTMKPQIFIDPDDAHAIVIVPGTCKGIFKISNAINFGQPMSDVFASALPGIPSSADYDPISNWLYIGNKSPGSTPATISIFNTTFMQYMDKTFTFGVGESDPAAMALRTVQGQPNPYVYIAFRGGPHIVGLKPPLDEHHEWTALGYAVLPPEYNSIADGMVADEFVYFATNQQRSKIFRVNFEDFCLPICHVGEFCDKGSCKCRTGYTRVDDICRDVYVITNTNKDNDGRNTAIALGVILVAVMIIGAYGWFLVISGKKGYKSVQ